MKLPDLNSIPTFLTFVCCGQSGHTILAAALDAHPNIMIGEEKKAIWRRRPKENLFLVVFEDSKNRVNSKNSYRSKVGKFPDLYKGVYVDKLQVIGDKCGWDVIGPQLDKENPTDRRLVRFRRIIAPSEHKIIHALRNPFDIISNWNSPSSGRKHIKHKGSSNLFRAIDLYEKYARTIQKVYYDRGYELLPIKNEDLCTNPGLTLERILSYLEVPCYGEWLTICSQTINPTHRRIKEVEWDSKSIKRVENIISSYKYLEGYTYE